MIYTEHTVEDFMRSWDVPLTSEELKWRKSAPSVKSTMHSKTHQSEMVRYYEKIACDLLGGMEVTKPYILDTYKCPVGRASRTIINAGKIFANYGIVISKIKHKDGSVSIKMH